MEEVVKFYIFLIYAGLAGKILNIGFQGGKLFGIFLATLFTSYLSFIRFIPLNSFIFFAFIALGLVIYLYSKKKVEIKREDLLSEGVFFIVFLFALYVRLHSSAIFGAEKPMEYAFVTSIGRSAHLPPYDPWLIGYRNPYYYFGFIPISLISKLLYIPNPIMYNLYNVFIFSISAGIVFEVLYKIKRSIPIGILGVITTLFMANYERFVALLRHQNLINYWASSRVIPNTINEFPLFSFIHGDNHPHYFFLPLSILGIYLIWKEKKVWMLFLFVFILIINPWSLPFFFFLWVVKRYIENGFKTDDIVDISTFLVGAIILALPFLYTRGHTPLGLGIVPKGSKLLPLFIHLGPFILLTLNMLKKKDIIILADYIKRYKYLLLLLIPVLIYRPSLFLGIFALSLFSITIKEKDRIRKFFLMLLMYGYVVVSGCEVLFIKDIYSGGAFYRGNTVFKFYFLSWILFAVSLSYLNLSKNNKLSIIILVLIIIPAFIYLPVGVKGRIDLASPPTLNGILFIKTRYPIDYNIIQYINKNIQGHPGIVEAVNKNKGAYTYYGRISTYTGLPTILGWKMHELVWRGYIPEGDEREKAVYTLYTGSMKEKEPFILKYKVKYMIIGTLEKKYYGEKLILPYSTKKIEVETIRVGNGYIFKFIF